MPIWEHEALKQPPGKVTHPRLSCVCVFFFFYFPFFFCRLHPHNFRVSVAVVCICLCIGTATIKHLLVWCEENAPKFRACVCECQKKMAVFREVGWKARVCVFGGRLFSHLVFWCGWENAFGFELWARCHKWPKPFFQGGTLSKTISHRDWWRNEIAKRIRQSRAWRYRFKGGALSLLVFGSG